MRSSRKKVWAGTLAAGVAGVLGFTALTSSAPADSDRGLEAPTITMEFDGMSPPHFDGPSKISEGSSLTVVNNTSPMEIGPHTFTLTEKKLIPDDKQSAKDCFKAKSKVCKRIFKAHKVDFENETVGKVLVEKGEVGWDTSFNEKDKGDSWFTQAEGDELTQAVLLSAGEKFAYFCVIHPEMQGKLKVVAAP